MSCELIWPAIVEAEKKNDVNYIPLAVFSYLLHRLNDVPSETLGQAMVDLEKRFRKEKMNIHCIARLTGPDRCSSDSLKNKTMYHLYVYIGNDAGAEKERVIQKSFTKQINNEKLLQSGFLEESTPEELLEKRKKALQLPSDLIVQDEKEFSKESIAKNVFCIHNANEIVEKCIQHAIDMSNHVWDTTVLQKTGMQVARTSILKTKWPETKLAIEKQMLNRQPMALKSVEDDSSLTEELIPAGYHLLGFSMQNLVENDEKKEECALFDLYYITERRYHFDCTMEEYDRLKKGQFSSDAEFVTFLTEKLKLSSENATKITIHNRAHHLYVSNHGDLW